MAQLNFENALRFAGKEEGASDGARSARASHPSRCPVSAVRRWARSGSRMSDRRRQSAPCADRWNGRGTDLTNPQTIASSIATLPHFLIYIGWAPGPLLAGNDGGWARSRDRVSCSAASSVCDPVQRRRGGRWPPGCLLRFPLGSRIRRPGPRLRRCSRAVGAPRMHFARSVQAN